MPASTKLKGRYELKEVLAKGGMGVVYRAVDGVMRRQVAIKTLLDITDAMGLQLFQKECEVLASMTHPNIIEIYDVGEFEEEGVSRPYLVMPLLPGVTLDKLIRASSQRLTVERSIDIACQACRGLQAAHEKGLVHRDIKPSNIFVLEDDSIKIIDFGVAHRIEATRTAGRKGTLLYMSPEQIDMKPVSAVSDIFSLGVVCYEMLTRRRPFERTSENSVADAILHFIPVPATELNPAVNLAVSQAIHKAMAKQPWHRYSAAKEFAETLQKAIRNEPIELFNAARMRPRLQRAMETLERGDCQYAAEIVGELEGEGHLDPAISELRRRIDEATRKKTIGQLLDTAHSRIETEEYPLALQKLHEVLQLDPANTEALSLKSKSRKQADGTRYGGVVPPGRTAPGAVRLQPRTRGTAAGSATQAEGNARAANALGRGTSATGAHARATGEGATVPGGSGGRSARRHQLGVEQAGAGTGPGSPRARRGGSRARNELSEPL